MNYVYINEDAIHHLLKCRICTKPFIDPVITRDGDRFCRSCVTHNRGNTLLNNSMIDQQSSFIDNLVNIDDKIIHDMLDNLLVKCPDCKELNIQRKDFAHHLRTQCLKRIVLCKACDLKCPWSGCYDQHDDHVSQCTFELLRPILSETCQYQNQLTEYRKCFQEQQNEIEALKKQVEQYEGRIERLQKGFKASVDLSAQQTLHYEKVKSDIQEIREYFTERNIQQDDLRNDIEHLRVLYNEMNMLYKESESPKGDSTNSQGLSTNELEQSLQQIKEHLSQSEGQMKKYKELGSNYENQIKQIQKQEQDRKKDMLHIRQVCDQHEIQIRLLARKKCVVPPKPITITNSPLVELIEVLEPNSEIDLEEQHFENQDIEYICKTAIIEKQCRKIRLENNDITAKGVAILASTLHGNTSLTELYLSKNAIGDMGAHALAQVLSINNFALTWLELHANNITDEGAEYLAEMLKTNKTLVLLGLSFNQIGDCGVRHLASSITYYNETLQWLHLASNEAITDGSVESLTDMFAHNKSLQALWLNDCSLSVDATQKLKKAVQSNKNFILEV